MSIIWGKRGNVAVVKAIKIPYPIHSGVLVYTGSALSPSWINYDENKIDISGTITAVDAGTYTTTFTPKDGYCWDDNTDKSYNVVWTIYMPLSVPTQSNTLIYNNAKQSPTWNNYNSDELTYAGTITGKDAGTYTAQFTPKDGYCWDDKTINTKSINWIINKATARVQKIEPSSLRLSLANDSDGVYVNIYYVCDNTALYGPTDPIGVTRPSCVTTSGGYGNPAKILVVPTAVGSGTIKFTKKDPNYNSITSNIPVTVTA